MLYMSNCIETSSFKRGKIVGTIPILIDVVTSKMLQLMFYIGPSIIYCTDGLKYF